MISLFHPVNRLTYEEVTKLEVPSYFEDLNLNQYADNVVALWEDKSLLPFFHYFTDSYDTTLYRQEIFSDLLNPVLRDAFQRFVSGIGTAIRYQQYSESISSSVQKAKWRLDCILQFYQTIENLCVDFNTIHPTARAFYSLHQELHKLLNTQEVLKLRQKANAIHQEFQNMRYRIVINKDRATLDFLYDSKDYCFPIRNAFEQGQADPTPVPFRETPFDSMELAPLENFVLQQFQKQNRVLFRDLETFCGIKREIISQELIDFLLELKFYLANIKYLEQMKEHGFPITMPMIIKDRELYLDDCYDIVLAHRNHKLGQEVVLNDIMKAGFEKAIIVTGPNQGGKTTLARAFGQCTYLGMMGLMIPSSVAKIPFTSHIFTHFACSNTNYGVEGRLENELNHLKEMLETVDGQSVVIMNELFASAPTMDALAMSRRLMAKLLDVGAICFFVTHTFEIAFDSDDYVSLVATVVEDGSFRRTYRIVRREADGIAFANSIVNKYKLDYSHINYRLRKQ